MTFGLLALCASASIDSESSDYGSTKITLAARKGPKGYASSLHRRKMSEINVPLGDYYLSTDLQYVILAFIATSVLNYVCFELEMDWQHLGLVAAGSSTTDHPDPPSAHNSVGRPPQMVAVIYDTGSYTLEIDG